MTIAAELDGGGHRIDGEVRVSSTADDLGGDPACWAHLFGGADDPSRVVVDLDATATAGAGGAVWSLPHGGDLDANLVWLGPGHTIGEHVNREVDVLVFVRTGTGRITIDDEVHDVRSDALALIPRGARRRIEAGPSGISYLSVHRRRDPLTIASPKQRGDFR